MTRPLELMVDIDEVIFPMIDSIHEVAFEAGLHDNSQPMRMWSGHKQYGCPEDVYWDLWSTFANAGGYVQTAPIPGAVEALRWLMWEGHNIHLVTARGMMNHAEEIRRWTAQWVDDFAVPHKTLTFSKDKAASQTELGVMFDSAIDDSPKNFENLQAAFVPVYLQDHTHNWDADVPAHRRLQSLWQWAYLLEKGEM